MNLLKPDLIYRNGYKDPKRMAAIQSIPCSLCIFLNEKQTTRTEAHHLHGKGLGKKVSDTLSMGLCSIHHRTGEFAFHHIGRIAFEEKFGIDQEGLIEITNKLLKIFNE